MNRVYFLVLIVLVPLIAINAIASTDQILRPRDSSGSGVVHGASINTSKAEGDTVVLMGPWSSGAPYNGQFQDQLGQPAWNGWTTADLTVTDETKWHVSDYLADNLGYAAPHGAGNMALWCGFDFTACNNDDLDGGYGNGWFQELHYRTPAADIADSTNITVNFQLNYDTEAGYDALIWYKVMYDAVEGDPELGFRDDVQIGFRTGTAWNDTVSFTIHFDADEYLNDMVDIMLVGMSDNSWSDIDCDYPTHGLCQIDDLEVILQSGNGIPTQVSFLDFDSGDSFAPWEAEYDGAYVGDYAWISVNGNMDECRNNGTPQAVFVNFGQYASQGVEASIGDTYRYGPNGYVVEYLGGAADDTYHLHNSVRSPVMPWPNDAYDGIEMRWDCYTHEEKTNVSTGMYYDYAMRSTPSEDPADIESSGFRGTGYVYYGGPAFLRERFNGTDVMFQGRQWVQVELVAYEIGWIFGIDGTDGVPAPSFDNVRVIVFPVLGPAFGGRQIDLAQSSFPAIGVVDYTDLGANSIRFDMAQSISPAAHERLDYGDSLVITCAPVRTGAVMAGNPVMHYKLRPNPLFDTYRLGEVPNEGEVVGIPYPGNKYAFDLPDTGFFYPGDVVHYYFRGVDDLEGDQTVTLMPGDTTGYSDLISPMNYDSRFKVRGLPTMYSATEGDQPKVLFYNDFGNRGGQNEWHFALNNLGINPSWDLDGTHVGGRYDTYYVQGPSSGVGNGIGGTASRFTLSGYDVILYTSGDLTDYGITDQDWDTDPGNDVGVLDGWLRQGNKSMLLTGDDLAYDLSIGTGNQIDFLVNWMGLRFSAQDIRPSIGGQATPLVKSIRTTDPVDDIFVSVPQWVVYGGCLTFNSFDAVIPNGAAVSLAEWTNEAGQTEQYNYSAATLNKVDEYSARVVTMPYDFMYVYTDPDEPDKASGTLSARARVLDAVLQYFGVAYDGANATDVPEPQAFTVNNFPNPFNPDTTIDYNMPKTGHLSLKVFNVRGELVRTLVDAVRAAGNGSEKWDGKDRSGASVASGVYFYEARTDGQVRVNKMALVK